MEGKHIMTSSERRIVILNYKGAKEPENDDLNRVYIAVGEHQYSDKVVNVSLDQAIRTAQRMRPDVIEIRYIPM